MVVTDGLSRGILVVPLFNEVERFAPDYWNEVAEKALVQLHFVDDGSTDGTSRMLGEFCRTHGYTLTLLAKNIGKANALRQGLIAAIGECDGQPVGFVDGDAVFAVSDICRLQSLMDREDLRSIEAFFSSRVALSGRDIRRRDSRHYIGRAIATLLSSAYSPMPYDSQSGLKLFRPSQTLLDILQTPFTTRWFFEMELLIRWKQKTGTAMRVWEEPVDSWFDAPGSKIGGRQVFQVTNELYQVITQARKSRPDA